LPLAGHSPSLKPWSILEIPTAWLSLSSGAGYCMTHSGGSGFSGCLPLKETAHRGSRPMGFELILPFLRPIEHLILDTEVSEIMVNGSGRIFVERHGDLAEIADVRLTEKNLQVAVRNIARSLGDEINEAQPLLDSRLPDGSRVAAVIPPCSIGGTTLTIRKFHSQRFTAEELVRIGSLTPQLLDQLRAAIERRENILLSGGTGTGKTTLLNALANFIGDSERIVVIEDTAEIQLEKPNLVRFEARREQPGIPAITIRDLVRATLRHRPDRIVLGEVRGGEAFDLLQALNTGHSGTLSTIHANSAQQAIARLTSCVLQAGVELPYTAIRANIADAIQLFLHIERRHGKRYAAELMRIERYEPSQDRYEFRTLFARAERLTEDGH
jgi:pilus assembly protein CpaF